jgi:hypothetical protein
MKLFKTMGLCVVGVLAFSAMALAGSASATPSVLHLLLVCAKAKGGDYTSKACTPASKVEGTGKYELESAVGQKATSKSKTSTLYSYIPQSESEPWKGGTVVGTIVCKKSAGTDEVTGPMTLSGDINFEDCASEGKKCTSPGNTTGDIKTNLLSGNIWLEKGKVVAVTSPASGEIDAEFNCEGLSVVTYGNAVGEVTGDIESASKSAKVTLTVNPKTGEPGISFAEEGPEQGEETLNLLTSHITPPGVTLPSGENTTQELKGSSAIGIYKR